jgi:hypothetical protein
MKVVPATACMANNADDIGLEIAPKYIQPNYVRCHLFDALFVIYSFDGPAKLQYLH